MAVWGVFFSLEDFVVARCVVGVDEGESKGVKLAKELLPPERWADLRPVP